MKCSEYKLKYNVKKLQVHSDDVRRKMSEKKIGYIPWNKRLTKLDERVLEGSIKQSKSLRESYRTGKVINPFKNKTYEEMFGIEGAISYKKKLKLFYKGQKKSVKTIKKWKDTIEKNNIKEVWRQKLLQNRLAGKYGYISKLETQILDALEKQNNIKIERQFALQGGLYDGHYDKYLFEVDGSYWHSLPYVIQNDLKKDKIAIVNGFELIRLRSLKDINKLNLGVSHES
jgi:hypothetical protein